MSCSSTVVEAGFAELERQRELITSCTALWKELTDYFSAMDQKVELRSEFIRSKRRALDICTQRKLAFLRRREESIDSSVNLAVARVEKLSAASSASIFSSEASDLPARLRAFSVKMDSDSLFDLIVSSRKESELLRKEIPLVLKESIDPAMLVMDAIARVFPIDRRPLKSRTGELGWVCVLLLEGLVSALSDPELGAERFLITRNAKEKAKVMATAWRNCFEQRGGVENAKVQDVHAYLQLLVTFGIGMKKEKEFYRKLVMSISWRKQIPKLAIALGLEDEMSKIIDELIVNGHQLDAINFAYASRLEEKYAPIPLLKSYLKDAKKAADLIYEEGNNISQSNAGRKEPSAIRAVMKCIEEHKLEAQFSLENLQKRLENLEKEKSEKRKASGAALNKRSRANNAGPMPPAKAGRLTNNAHVSSFPTSVPTFVMSPSQASYSPLLLPYSYERIAGHGIYGNHSPTVMRDSFPYLSDKMVSAPIIASYPSHHPISYPAYAGYSAGMGTYSNGGNQQGYYTL